MRIKTNYLILIKALLIAPLLITGCSYPIWSRNAPSAFQTTFNNQVKNKVPGTALVAIRWPVAIDDKARAMFEKTWADGNMDERYHDAPLLYINSAIAMAALGSYWWAHKPWYNTETWKQIPDSSTYYAMELYRSLTKTIPENEIVLEPQYLTSSNGKLLSSPISRNTLPVAFVVDISNRVEGRPEQGWVFHPIITIKTSGSASQRTCGAIAGSDDYSEIPEFIISECANISSRSALAPDYWDHWFSDKPNNNFTSVPTQTEPPLTPDTFTKIPAMLEDFSHNYLAMSASPGFDSKHELKNTAGNIYASSLAAGMSNFDLNKATHIGMAEYVGEYDPALKNRIIGEAALTNEEMTKFAAISKLGDIEKSWITKQDKHIADTILDGPYGQSFRATRLSLKDASNRQQAESDAMAMTMVASMANSGMLSGGHHTATQSLQMLSDTVLVLLQHQANVQAIEDEFYSQFGDEIKLREQVMEVNLTGNNTRQVTAKNRQELRKELKSIYGDFVNKLKWPS